MTTLILSSDNRREKKVIKFTLVPTIPIMGKWTQTNKIMKLGTNSDQKL